ncbi:MAG: hypothetical protein LCH96_04345 [Actinobacteria bacterium]|nr:hypothetical protein [Actinomycetota bacterium]
MALWAGLALIRRVDASYEQHLIRTRRPASYEAARQQAEADRDRARQRASMVFWSIR